MKTQEKGTKVKKKRNKAHKKGTKTQEKRYKTHQAPSPLVAAPDLETALDLIKCLIKVK